MHSSWKQRNPAFTASERLLELVAIAEDRLTAVEFAALQVGPLRSVATIYRRIKEGAIAPIEDRGRIHFLELQVRVHFSVRSATTSSGVLRIAHGSAKLHAATAFDSIELSA